MSDVIEVGKSNWDEEVTKSDIPVLVDFWAKWCGPCRMLKPVLEEIARDYKGKLKVVSVEVDNHPDLAAQFLVRSIPALFLIKNGNVVAQMTGYIPKEEIIRRIVTYI